MTMFYGSPISGTWSGYIETKTITNYAASATVTIDYGVYFNKAHEHETKYDEFTGASSNSTSHPNLTIPVGKWDKSKGYKLKFGSASFSFTKNHGTYTGYISISIKHGGSGAKWKGTSSPKATFTIGAKTSYAVSYNGNSPTDETPTNIPANQTKWYSENLTLSGIIPQIEDKRFAFTYWNTKADGTGTSYSPSTTYSANAALPLYAIWDKVFPPSMSADDYALTGKEVEGNAILGFTGVSVTCTDLASYNDGNTDKTLSSLSLVIGTTTVKTITSFTTGTKDADGTQHYADVTISATAQEIKTAGLTAGTYPVYVVLTDSNGKQTTLSFGDDENPRNITIVNPTWAKTIEINQPPPATVLGNAVLDTIEVKNYTDDTWETVTGNFPVTIVSDSKWTFPYTFTEDYVDDPTDDDPEINVRVSYKHYDSYEKEYRSAFFSTTRNQNYSNGIYNTMFVSGAVDFPNFTSRVWWCQVNNPLYFPETNYIEVGSNDTMVMGLTKVGDYLAAIKQSKTTDTAIFLIFPTSFEEETTYAVKQGVQGVGALARYSFNILGDETLFLSPNGVMAIVPSEDEEHKVQNRSFFVDGRLLKEPELSDAYSFVFDGKYYLSTGSGAVYVLDGNQRNSWGNDKTNLVYECYYLDNVPARCFVKFDDRLVFSTYSDICKVGDGYYDAYDTETKEPNAPVKAEWSTIFDDDGALHYYKTMQKKGNLVSILPEETDEERTHTKVYVKKDDKPEVEIERTFGVNSTIPSEMFLKKKFKKYKRLQFIIRNEEPEPFGVDSIIKNYTIGNYCKR